MRPMAGAASLRSARQSPEAHRKRSTASQALPEPIRGARMGRRRGAAGESQGDPAPALADYCEPYHCDPPREDPKERLLKTLQHEVLLGTW